jgi:hypothetical protein
MHEDRERAHLAWRRADRIRYLSDDLMRVGPVGVGIDGLIAWIPGAGTIYSVGAAALLFNEAVAAGASRATLLKMAGWLGLDSATSTVPIVGWAVDTLFRGHSMSAKALQKDIERRHGRPMTDVTPERPVEPVFTAPLNRP